MTIKCISRDWLRKWICNHFVCRYVLYVDFSMCNHVSYEIVLYIYVFGFLMIFGIFSECNCGLPIAIHHCHSRCIFVESQMVQKSFYPNNLLYNVIQVCFLLAQEIAPLFNKKAYPDVDFLSSKSPPQSASVYPIRFWSYP